MALSSAFWRLNLLSKPSVSLRALKPFKPKPRPMSSIPISSKSNSSNFSASKNPTSLDPKTRTPYPQHDLIVLGIETSCDYTAAAAEKSNGEILSQVISSQADLLAQYGGVAPKMAEEAHLQVIDRTPSLYLSCFCYACFASHHLLLTSVLDDLVISYYHF
ncbi:putative N(6)-L-threonylcarbamoyladenine synthase [Rosa chinensis]|uniref:Putative N(6)-L-threonylcarbamoyladenine synthase n=1 Tax=Rosa chinensis TaxID=74649 RepID=A0A2P6SFW3_ROSCH|nr:putative N(6)-L-threonylcarbamoyladenine synthase [Rosa chinensis]